MKIAYGTYAMPNTPFEEAFPMLAGIGYDGVEVCVSPRHVGADLPDLDASRRARLRDLLAETGLGVPAVFMLGHLLNSNPEEHRATMARVRECAQLGRDLGAGDEPVVAVGFGGRRDDWESVRGQMADLLGDYGALAEEEGFVLAGEAHCGAAVDRSERVVWLMEQVGHPRVRFHFDIVHLFLAGEDIAQVVRTVLPYTAHTHITDAIRHEDGTFALVLLGRGQLDSVEYIRAMKQEGWESFITLEVSTMVWSKDDYDVRLAAEECYAALDGAFKAAGVARG